MEKGMTASSQKETKFIFRIKEDLLRKYKSICEQNGYDVSKKIRLFIENEIAENEGELISKIKLENIYDEIRSYLYNVEDSGEKYTCETIKTNLDRIIFGFVEKGVIFNFFNNCEIKNHPWKKQYNENEIINEFEKELLTNSKEFIQINIFIEQKKGMGILNSHWSIKY